jgi:peptide/nickel transport system permease protein
VMGLSVLGFSVPVFVIGYVLIKVFALDLRWLPVQGFKSLSSGLGQFLERLVLPTCALSFIYVALIARMTRAAMLDVLGLLIGLVSGFFKWIDAVMMRTMDGLMAIPSILLAIAVVSLSGASVMTVLIAITIPEIPRVARLVRSVVLSAREEPYVEAAISVGSSLPKIMWRHLMPNTIAPLIVQGTYVCASAILTEAILSFLGTGINPETPTWGNIMAEGRAFFQIKPSLIFWPGLVLSIAILSVNLIGDAARDALDPRLKQREGGK